MQLKGLVRFFTVLLILISLYVLSFTWAVRSHENKMAEKAKRFVSQNFSGADSTAKAAAYAARYNRLLDSTKDVTVHYGPTGAISYKKAKEQELNLGLDLQGGINVTLEVELSGLLRSLAGNSKDPNFLKALDNAILRKKNSNANYINLFVEEYKKLAPDGRLASLFAANSGGRIKLADSDANVVSELKKSANVAFDNAYRILYKRIDQFGVAQPTINPDKDRDIIIVELPGIDELQKDRVTRILQSSANLRFWLVYKPEEVAAAWGGVEKDYAVYVAGTDTSKSPKDTTKKRSLAQDFAIGMDGGYNMNVALSDTARFREMLAIPSIRKNFPADAVFAYGTTPRDKDNKELKATPLYILKTNGSTTPPMEGSVITTADQQYDQMGSKPNVTMDMNATGARKWENLTEISYKEKRPIAIELDGVVLSAPIAHNGKISGGRTEITGDFTVQEAQDIAHLLTAGRMDAPTKIVSEEFVGPTLGKDAIRGGMLAFAISFVVIFLLMLVYYNTSGWVANIALILNLLFTIGILTAFGATLTAPGIAGLVLTIGMAVDTNVIIYERIKEELTKGKNYVQAVNEGYKRSLPPVLDAHVTTLLTAIILFSFGLGPVKGFATTQIIGILLSLFCGILVSRWVSDMFTNKKRHLEYFTPISRRIFKHANFKFIEYRKVAYVISFVVLALGIGAIFNGFDQGVEFKGGRSYKIRFDHSIGSSVEQIRKDLAAPKIFGESPVIKTIGGNNQLDITTTYQIDNTAPTADSTVQHKLYEGLQPFLPAGTTYEQFDKQHKLGSTKVLPTISDDLKSGAIKATIFSILIICLYIFIRFRDWRYSLGTIIALLHDVLLTMAVFSFLRNIVPFPLEMDQHFIAAVLTVIGFSMNDTVIVFDRIREYSRQMLGLPKEQIINKAINETLSRTIMTSLTVFLTILILFLVGGEVTKGFAFAMLIGVVTGTYSSVFVAAPILVDLGGKRALGDNSAPAATDTKAKPVLQKQV